jgi:hypothetical protein
MASVPGSLTKARPKFGSGTVKLTKNALARRDSSARSF